MSFESTQVDAAGWTGYTGSRKTGRDVKGDPKKGTATLKRVILKGIICAGMVGAPLCSVRPAYAQLTVVVKTRMRCNTGAPVACAKTCFPTPPAAVPVVSVGGVTVTMYFTDQVIGTTDTRKSCVGQPPGLVTLQCCRFRKICGIYRSFLNPYATGFGMGCDGVAARTQINWVDDCTVGYAGIFSVMRCD
jgi:hypothetical protein